MGLKITRNQYPLLRSRISITKKSLPEIGERWSREAIQNLKRHLFHHLETQGRGGQPPPLSEATKKIYRATKNPDGSGIRNHIMINTHQEGGKHTGILGVPKGKPTTVSRVQENGAVIKVTPKMRAFLHSVGIHLRAETGTISIPARYFWSMGNEGSRREAKALLKRLIQEI